MSPHPLGDVIPDVERLVEIGDASSIEPIRELLSRIDEALWIDVPSKSFKVQGRRTETDFDISYWDRKDIPNRIHDLLETLIFRIGEAEAGEYHRGDHAPSERRPGLRRSTCPTSSSRSSAEAGGASSGGKSPRGCVCGPLSSTMPMGPRSRTSSRGATRCPTPLRRIVLRRA